MRKNKTKKMGLGLATLALIAAMALPAAADENKQSKEMDVKASVGSGYTLTVPSTVVEIPFKRVNTELKITVSGNIEKGKSIKVTTEDGSLKTSAGDALSYTIDKKELTWNDTELDKGRDNGVEKTTNLNIPLASWEAAKAGTYEGTVTFTAEMQ